MSQQVVPYTIPAEPHQWRSVVLSLLVHLALLAFLWVGVSWQSLTPTTVEAEIWDVIQRDAAPPPPEPEPEPPKPEPEPPKPAPTPKAPVVVPEPPKVKSGDPDIALEQEKKRKQQKEKERLAEEKQQREEQERKRLAEEEKRQKEEQALKDKKKLEEEQKHKQEVAEAEEKKRKQEAAAAEEQKRKEAAAAEERKRKEAAAAEKQRARSALADDLSKAGDGDEGTAEKKSGAPGTVCELFIGKTVKSNTSFPNMPGDPVVTVRISLTPGRMLKEVKVVKPSEYLEFDKQVERGIRKSGQFPRECPEDFIYPHYLKTR